ncbi:MAG: hypothetical protein ACI9MS_000340 [Glaciecola sp.]|jgi:hypothetical protein
MTDNYRLSTLCILNVLLPAQKCSNLVVEDGEPLLNLLTNYTVKLVGGAIGGKALAAIDS